MRRMIYLNLIALLLVISMLGYGYLRYAELDLENKQLKQELQAANEKTKTSEELYELRNFLDVGVYEFLAHMEQGDTDYLKGIVSDNVTVTEDKLIFKNKEGPIEEYVFPDSKLIVRQRAYWLNDNKDEYISIYEIRSGGSQPGRFNTLNFRFVFENEKWLLDFVNEDE